MTDISMGNLAAAMMRNRTADMQAMRQKEGTETAELQKASEQFESLLLHFMIREMRATVPESRLFPRSMAEDIFTGMLDERIASEMAQNGGIGISRMIFEQLRTKKGQ